ncbi:DEAD/DEAH box helicase family protein [Methylomonas sp. TEB]|uniref:DEAD/DEAH box helicase family protein n=1 Tax=Methylomonas sp. TEB TaxID=3398229 RepID=UPI0039F62E04
MQILGGRLLAGSLKSHEIRLGLLNVQDLPYPPGSILTDEQIAVVDEYCQNDVDATEALYFDLDKEIQVRRDVNAEYPFLKQSALRRSNASIAEAVMKHQFFKRTGLTSFQIKKPERFAFDPVTRIDSAIKFSSVHNQQYLQRLRKLPMFEAQDWVGKNMSDPFIFKVGDHSIKLGSGGAHTIIGHCAIESAAIMEFDVASYYPNLLRKFNRSPAGLTEAWIAILNGLTDDRLAAKHSGDKGKADVYKIIINSLFGKLADQFSFNRDDALQLQVTINGQLFLIMLMERFHEAGFEVISGNTDGVYINAGDRPEEAQTVANQWMQDTGFLLESKTSTKYVATAINDYALYHPDQGWYHKKGRFAPGKRTRPSIVTDAVLHAISSGEGVEGFIRNGQSVLEYLYSGSVRDKKTIAIRHGDKTVQKSNRWYKSINGHPIEKCVKNTNGTLKWSRVSNSESSIVANRLTDYSVPEDLDFDFYIQEAQALLDEITEGKKAKETGKSKLVLAAEKAQAKGLVVVPKGKHGKGYEKASVKDTFAPETVAYWRETPLDQADWFGFVGFGAYTGPEFNLVGIDIDNPEKAKDTRLFELIGKTGMVCWHGDWEPDDVRMGEVRGTLLFKYSGDQLKTTGGQFLKDNGFEILYGKKVVQLAGLHHTGEKYTFKGKLTAIPQALTEYLAWRIPEQDTEREEPADGETQNDVFKRRLLMEFQQIANADPEYVSVGGELELKSTPQGPMLKGLCVAHQQHSNQKNDQNMSILMWDGRLITSCYHQSCTSTRKAWQYRINDQLTLQRDVVVNPKNLVVAEEAKEIAEALQDESRYKLIMASTGSGKTHTVVTHILPFLDKESGNQDKFAVICSSKDQMLQIAERFGRLLETDNINELGIDLIEATGDIRLGRAKSIDTVRSATRVAITHFTYVSRRRFSNYYYAFLKFIDQDTHVLIDEVDAFVESQVSNLPLGSRWRRYDKAGKIKNDQLMKCGMFHGFNNCANCTMRQYDGYKIDVDQYRNLGYIPVGEFMEGIGLERLEHIDIDSRTVGKIRVGNNEITMLRQYYEPGPVLFEQPGEDPMADFKAIFEDHMNAGYLPTVYRSVIVYNGEEITREEVVNRFGINARLTLSSVPEDERRKLRFPSRVCNVMTVTTIDRRPIRWMAKAKSVTGLTATLTPLNQQFLADMLPGLKRFDIPPKDDRKMDKIIVVGTRTHLPLKVMIDGHWRFNKMFRFRETYNDALRDFEALSKTEIPVRLGFSKSKTMLTSDQDEYGQHKVLQTYSFGSLGRGIDFANYPLVDINAGVYKPVSVHVCDDPDVIKATILEDRANTLTQNIGRILRRPKGDGRVVKMVVLEELVDEDELSTIAKELAAMSIEAVESWWTPCHLTKEEIGEWLTKIESGQSIPEDIPRDYQDLIGRAKRLVESGATKKEIKLKLRWSTVRKYLSQHEVAEVEQVIDDLLANVRSEGGVMNDKVFRQRERRLKTIGNLKSKGKSEAVIRRDMKVYDSKNPWTKSEQSWFETVVKTVKPEQYIDTPVETDEPGVPG